MFHMDMDDILDEAGASDETWRKMLTCTRRSVTSSAMRPGTICGGMRKLIQLEMTKRDVGR